MRNPTALDPTSRSARLIRAAERLNLRAAFDIVLLSAWCGLAGGLLEVGSRVLCRFISPTSRLFLMTRHFYWLTPLVNLAGFIALGLVLVAITKLWPRFGFWLTPRLVFALATVPIFLVAVPQIYPEASLLLAFGLAIQCVPILGRSPVRLRRQMVWTFPGLLILVMILGGSLFVGDWIKQRRELGRALPPAGSPNVLLIVLDTVRADRLSLYGYHRATTPVLERLAKKGIRFDAARATAPWTLASHASFFSGRWPHELGVEWETPLPTKFPMLAEYLGSRGYATAGLVANTIYCSYDTGLDRGFTHYEDYVLQKFGFVRTAALIEEVRKSLLLWIYAAFHNDVSALHSARDFVATWSGSDARRDAGSLNRSFLKWLDDRPEQDRPFFAFLNYLDAHAPYKLPPDAAPRFSRRPQSADELTVIYDDWTALDKLRLPPYYLKLARDSYDNCIAYLDEKIGELHDDLRTRGVLDRTWIVITGDHGEGLGEHDLYEHGESLYSTEIRVPLLILPPPGAQSKIGAVTKTVSLRDLAATIVDIVGLGRGAPFPGLSLANLWSNRSSLAAQPDVHEVFSELPSPSRLDSSHGRSPARRGPLVSLADDDLIYIFNEGDRAEELYSQRDDPRELTNLAARPALLQDLERFRRRLAELRGSSGREPGQVD
jgi:arylsulfatase A-like enzyme